MDSLGTREGILLLKKLISLKTHWCIVTRETAWTLKAGDYAIYLDYVISGQLILANNCSDLDNYKLKENKVMLYVLLHNTENRYFRGVKKWLAYIMVRGDSDEIFFLYCHEKERSQIMYSSFKHPIPNIFQDTAFKKHTQILIKEKAIADSSKLFFFLPSITDCKKKINKFFNNVHLHSIDCAYEGLSNYSLKNKTFYPQHLDPRFPEEWEAAKEIVLSDFRHIAEISNSNLIRNANSLIAKNEIKIDPEVELNWIGETDPQNQTKFKLGYYLL